MSVHSVSRYEACMEEQMWDCFVVALGFSSRLPFLVVAGACSLVASNRKVKCRFLFCPQRKVCIQHVVPVHISYLVQSRLQRITSPLSKYWSDFRENIVCESYISFKIEFREFLIDLVHLTFYWTNGIFDIITIFCHFKRTIKGCFVSAKFNFLY